MIKNQTSTLITGSSVLSSEKKNKFYDVGDSVFFKDQVMNVVGIINNEILFLDYLSYPHDIVRTTIQSVTPIPITMKILAQNSFVQKLDGILSRNIEDVTITYFMDNQCVFVQSQRCDLHIKNITSVHELQQILRVLDLKFWDDFTLYKS